MLVRMKLRYFLILAALVGWFAHDGQAQDVTQAATFTGAASAPIVVVKAGSPGGSSTWALTWYVTGFTAATVHLQGSQDCSSFSDITTAALILEGTNPTVWTSSTVSNRMVVRSYLPCVQVTVDTLTGSGSVVTLLLGYKGSNATPISAGGSGGTTPVIIVGADHLYSGQQAVTGSAVALATQASKFVCVSASVGNTINVYVGPSGITTSTGFELAPGGGYCAYLSNVNLFYVIASTTGAKVTWAATN